jgi:hypothetical protein
MADLVDILLSSVSPETLLKSYASLTHQIHEATGSAENDLREQRDIVAAEIKHRMVEADDPVDMTVAEDGYEQARPKCVIDCPSCKATGTIQQTGDDCDTCKTYGRIQVEVIGPDPRKVQQREDFLVRTGYEG